MTRESFSAAHALTELKDFQRDTVTHVMDRFHGASPTSRFLVADETGLGKSIVARGVIAETIEKLQTDPDVKQINIVYVCSNSDLAKQNLRRLNVTGEDGLTLASRLTMLAVESGHLNSPDRRWQKPINLVSFTPGTSFNHGTNLGTARERALLFLLLRDSLELKGARGTAAQRVLQGKVEQFHSFRREVERLDTEHGTGLNETIKRKFIKDASRGGDASLINQFRNLTSQTVGRSGLSSSAKSASKELIGKLRQLLATASISTLRPSLVILDEFQRFRELLNTQSDAGELASHLFSYADARVLLLSATPYKMFTYAEEAAADGSHQTNFLETLDFLAAGGSIVDTDEIRLLLDSFRDEVVQGGDASELTRKLRDSLLHLMTRAERPRTSTSSSTLERQQIAPTSRANELVGYALLRQLAKQVDGQMSVEYWKSAPYFVNFMEGYQIRHKVDELLRDPARQAEISSLLGASHQLKTTDLDNFSPIDLGNGKLRNLAAETVEAGWDQLLWVPPTMPYLTPTGPFADPRVANMTKRLIFSSWNATPTAVASLLSYEATRRLAGARGPEIGNTPEGRRRIPPRLTYRLARGEPASMTTLALFWPMPGLASLADPLDSSRHYDGAADPDNAVGDTARAIRELIEPESSELTSSPDSWYWAAAFRWPDSIPEEAETKAGLTAIREALLGNVSEEESEDHSDPSGLTAHIQAALSPPGQLGRQPRNLPRTLAELAMHSPANCAWRALGRLFEPGAVSAAGHWRAAAILAAGLRSMFNRWESTLLLDQLYPEMPHWRAVLQYCAAGNLQALLDEYLFHVDAEAMQNLDDIHLEQLAKRAASAMSLRSATYSAFNPSSPSDPIRLQSRFALRYGNSREQEKSERSGEVREAFNSPFWPFVLASTSVGQEGIDFHWWCHSLVHWNVPANPVDFEQREGRVDRFRGHAIRRNIVDRHRKTIVDSGGGSPWAAAYKIAGEGVDQRGGLVPDWLYPGPFAVERVLYPYAMSSDQTRLARMKADLAVYRLAFGQNRQEDLVEILKQRGIDQMPEVVEALRIDLTAPERVRRSPLS